MICQRCQKTKATVHLTDIIPPTGEARDRHLCEHCAQEEGIVTKQHIGVNSTIEELVKQKSQIEEMADRMCDQCGITFREFRSSGVLGCPNDYAAFDDLLTPMIRRAHEEGDHHVGKIPPTSEQRSPRASESQKLRRQVTVLQKELDEAVRVENYRRAASLRDEITAVRNQLERSNES